ncbi:LuxR C-terminal-related transcriptional regulator [Microbacterium sp. MYb62]|uniref:LuxR C-terminal-related transcriptional regulator n=1 Tax=Microbacterium sp. MYb62 TaxID=1848690 RepID=UPI000CFE1B51|nr:LuxR C-terminal-related transcriptional regulator [Microbacterium sp. MYb62]PRB13250.1 helix-turn-helix transcriptional regulator [Microbacterium sp. MYb62]
MSAHAIGRPRLNAALDTDIPLTLLRSASGSGKTTALVEWASTTASRVVWVTVTPAIATSEALAHALLQALPRGDHPHPADRNEGWDAATSRLRSAEGALVVVLDDAAAVDREGVFALCRAVATAPRARLIVATNRPSPFDSEGLDLVIDTTILAPEDLMFDTDEVRRALGADAETAAVVREATGGFPALIRALAIRGTDVDPSALDAATTAIEDYLRARLAECAFDPQALHGLLRISITDTVDLPLAVALTDDPDIADTLDQAEMFGFGRWATDGRSSFALAPLARGMLRRELRRTFADEVSALRRIAAEGAVRRGIPFEGLRLAVEDDDLRLATHVTMSGWNHLLHRDRHAVVELLGDIPVARFKQEPLVAMLLGMCLKPSRLRRARGLQLLRMAISAANARRTTLSATERIFIWAAESASLRVIGRPERAGQVAARAVALFAEIPESQWQQYAGDMPLLCTHLGISLYAAGQHEEAVHLWEQATALAAVHGNANAFHGLCLLGGVHALHGDLPEARRYVALIRDGDWDPALLDSYRGSFYRVAEAMLAVEEGDLAEAKRHVRLFEPYRATSEHWTTMATVEAWVALHDGEPAAGLERLESFARLRGKEAGATHVRQALFRPRALLHLALGDLSAARSAVQRDAAPDRFGTLLERARLALVDGRAADVVRLLAHTRLQPATARERAEAAAVNSAALHQVSPAAAQPSTETLGLQLIDRELTTPLALLSAEDFGVVRDDLDPTGRAALPLRSALPSFASRPRLSSREQVVLQALTSGAPLPTIAAELSVSQNTLKTQLRSLYRKLSARNRTEAMEQAARHGLLPE